MRIAPRFVGLFAKVKFIVTKVWAHDRGFFSARQSAVDIRGPYLNGSVPYGTGPESESLRLKRFLCASFNHYPRKYNGSWCYGYGYVCGRCYMYADPWSKSKAADIAEALGSNPDQMDIAAVCGGGPSAGQLR